MTVAERTLGAFRRRLDDRGITADDIIGEIERHQDDTFRAFYPEMD